MVEFLVIFLCGMLLYCTPILNNVLIQPILFVGPILFLLSSLYASGSPRPAAAAKLEEMEVDVGCSSGELNELTLLGRHLSLQHAYGLGACLRLVLHTIYRPFLPESRLTSPITVSSESLS